MDPLEIEKIHAMMDSYVHGNGSAKCAIDIALYDLKGKFMNQPLYRVLGGYDNQVLNGITVVINPPEKMAAQAKHFVEDLGYHILKIKMGISPQDDLEALRLIREAVGPDIRLRIDANQGYDYSQALFMLQEMKKYGVEAAEQCLPDWDLDGAARLRRQSNGVQLMLDESLHTIRDAARICKAEAADIMNIKLMKCGGLYRASQINAVGESFVVPCMVGCMIETKISITAGLSLVAAKKNITESDCDTFLFYKDGDTGMPGGFQMQNDRFFLLDRPGLGLDISF